MDNIKLHLACGKVKLAEWLNIDIDSDAADLELDLTKGLPFDDSSVQYIYCEHFIEHVTRTEALNILKECYRVLNSNGILRFSTPDLNFLVMAYLSENIHEWGEAWQPANLCHLMNEGMRSWGHQFLYNADELRLILAEAGFMFKKFVKWGESQFEELKNIESRPFHGELIIEAYKSEHHLELQDDTLCGDDKKDVEHDLLQIITNLKESFNHVAYKSDYVKGLENELLSYSHRTTAAEQTISDQVNHIKAVEAELSRQVNSSEQKISNQMNEIQSLEAELLKRGQYIHELESTVSSYVQHIKNIEDYLDKIKGFMAVRVLKLFYKDLR